MLDWIMDSAQRPSDGTSGVFNSNQLEFESSDESADESAASFGAKIIRKNLFSTESPKWIFSVIQSATKGICKCLNELTGSILTDKQVAGLRLKSEITF